MTIDPEQAIFGSAGNPLDYPGQLPDRPYLLLGAEAHAISNAWPREQPRLAATGQTVDDALVARGSAPLSQRVASIAFGANRDLRNLAWKLSNYHRDVAGRASGDLVVIPARIPDADVVACNVGYWGYVYGALLLHRPPSLNRAYLSGTTAPVALLLVDRDQMAMLHASEGVPRARDPERRGVSCDVALFDLEVDGLHVTAQLYVLALPFLSFDGSSPVPFRSVRTTGRRAHIQPLGQEELWLRIWETLSLRERVGGDWRQAVERLRRAALARRLGADVDRADERLYELIRREVASRLALRDADGLTRTALDDMHGLLTPAEAWTFAPTSVAVL